MKPVVGRELTAPPTGQAVERLALVMAASVGQIWAKLDAETALQFRVMANAVLTRLGVDALEEGAVHLRATIAQGAESLRRAASLADFNKEREDLIHRLHRDATNMETMAMILNGTGPEVPSLPAPTDDQPEETV